MDADGGDESDREHNDYGGGDGNCCSSQAAQRAWTRVGRHNHTFPTISRLYP
jgi:hypothetical protein